MDRTLMYRLSLGLTIVLSLAAFITLVGWLGSAIAGTLRVPWLPLLFIALAGLNCTLRARVILRR